jgi:glycosyltransferase involved in cell wall biosynthesis
MIKVTFLTGEYPPMQGGIADHTAHLASQMTPLGIEPSILTSRRWADEPAMPGSPPTGAAPVWPVVSGWGRRCWRDVAAFLAQHRPDVLHIQYQAAAFDLGGWVNWLPWYLKQKRAPVKIVTTFHDLRVPYIFPKAGPFRRKSMLALAGHSDAVICTNREDQQAIGDRQPACYHIPLGSNVEPCPPPHFSRTEWRARYGADYNSLLLAYFGFLNHSKGGEELIEALALLRQQGIDAQLLLIGGEVGHVDATNLAYARKVEALIAELGLAEVVHRTGYVELAEVSANLLAADAVVMPYRDGVSFRRTTLIAALRHGCPVVSTAPPNPAIVPEIEPGENMLLAAPHNALSLAETIAALADNLPLRETLSYGALKLGNQFEWPEIASQTAALYQILGE